MASKRHQRRRSCQGKKHHPFMFNAITEAKRLRVRNPGDDYDAYACVCGNGFVVGHRTKRVRQQIEQRRALR